MDFLQELNSELILLLVLGPLGIKKGISLALRSCIEDTCRHIYYKDHPIELISLQENGDSDLTNSDLIKYLQDHPLYKKRSNFNKLMSYVENSYHEESKILHSSSKNYFSSLKTLADISRDVSYLANKIDGISHLISCLLSLLIIFHKDKFQNMNPSDRHIILSNVRSILYAFV